MSIWSVPFLEVLAGHFAWRLGPMCHDMFWICSTTWEATPVVTTVVFNDVWCTAFAGSVGMFILSCSLFTKSAELEISVSKKQTPKHQEMPRARHLLRVPSSCRSWHWHNPTWWWCYLRPTAPNCQGDPLRTASTPVQLRLSHALSLPWTWQSWCQKGLSLPHSAVKSRFFMRFYRINYPTMCESHLGPNMHTTKLLQTTFRKNASRTPGKPNLLPSSCGLSVGHVANGAHLSEYGQHRCNSICAKEGAVIVWRAERTNHMQERWRCQLVVGVVGMVGMVGVAAAALIIVIITIIMTWWPDDLMRCD